MSIALTELRHPTMTSGRPHLRLICNLSDFELQFRSRAAGCDPSIWPAMRRRRPAMRRLYAPAGLKRVAGRWRGRRGPDNAARISLSRPLHSISRSLSSYLAQVVLTRTPMYGTGNLKRWGISTFEMDSFAGRGIVSTVVDQSPRAIPEPTFYPHKI